MGRGPVHERQDVWQGWQVEENVELGQDVWHVEFRRILFGSAQAVHDVCVPAKHSKQSPWHLIHSPDVCDK